MVLHTGDPRAHGPSEPLLRTGRVATARGTRIAANLRVEVTDPGDDTLPVHALRPQEQPSPPRPTALPYRLRVGSGEPIALDVPVVFGRRPALSRGADGTGTALVTVPSPKRTVSSTHLRVSQTGPTVIATDLRSTNGTTVHAPGFRARRLRQGESTVVVPGTRIDIGDGNIVEILPVQAVSPPGIRPEEPR
ncbi:FHA domain-containing protein [Microbacteriaceae bacterium VKM Ac-2854]|nr:FHA domain-containing protein [Microbacteriaceae bacterium VKM Ac-2854]